MNDPHGLRNVEIFADLSDDQIAWLSEHAEIITLDAGEALFHEGDVPGSLYGVIEGELRLRREQGPPDDRWIVRPAGKVTGALPHSRMKFSPVTARALVPTRIASIAKEVVPQMLDRIPVLHGRLPTVMVDRSREFTRHEERRERLVSLGKLSAGLAHELNNPASAIQRRVDELSRRLLDLSDLVAAGFGSDALRDRLAALRDAASTAPAQATSALDVLQRSDAQDALATSLTDLGLPDAWLTAETLVSVGVTVDALEEALRSLPRDAWPAAVRWIAADLASRRLLTDVAEATRRMVDLISAVKSYSNQDRAPTKSPTDVNEGVRSTIAMLAHKIRSGGVQVEMELLPDLPPVNANPGELNQVWTNLIDNAIDALPPGGSVTVRTSRSPDGVCVRISDDGPGIPADVQAHVFEPFFTTKGVGEGAGLGLDIVRRIVRGHEGDVHLETGPDGTAFEVRLPGIAQDAAT